MVDLETLSTSMDASILTIGAIAFDDAGNYVDTFYRRVDRESCKELKLSERQDTIDFWSNQSAASRKESFSPTNRLPIRDVMAEFTTFFLKNRGDELWCNGANFDEPILSTVYERLNEASSTDGGSVDEVGKPWKFWNVRCVRTLMAVCGKNMRDFGPVAHHALEDCKKQIEAVVYCQKYIATGHPSRRER